MSSKNEVLLLLGGDLGDQKATFSRAEHMLEKAVGPILARSRDHWTEPWGFAGERLFLNRALLLATGLAPVEILQNSLKVELALGRVREDEQGYASRIMDVDILMIGDLVVDSPAITIPHPRMHLRRFALAPAADIAPHWHHPLLGPSILQLLNTLQQREAVSAV